MEIIFSIICQLIKKAENKIIILRGNFFMKGQICMKKIRKMAAVVIAAVMCLCSVPTMKAEAAYTTVEAVTQSVMYTTSRTLGYADDFETVLISSFPIGTPLQLTGLATRYDDEGYTSTMYQAVLRIR